MDLLFSGILHRRFRDRTLYAGESVATRLYDPRGLFGRLSADTLSDPDEDPGPALDRLKSCTKRLDSFAVSALTFHHYNTSKLKKYFSKNDL